MGTRKLKFGRNAKMRKTKMRKTKMRKTKMRKTKMRKTKMRKTKMIKKGGLGEEKENASVEEEKNEPPEKKENEPLEENKNASVEEEKNASVKEEKNESVKEKKNEPVDVTGVLEQDAEDKNESVEEEKKKNEPVPDIVEQSDAVAPEIQSGVINESNKLSKTLLNNTKISELVKKNPNIENAILLFQHFLPETATKMNTFLEKNPDFLTEMNLDAMSVATNDNDRVDAFVDAYNSIIKDEKPLIDEVSIENAKKKSTGETGFEEDFVTTLKCTRDKGDHMVLCKEEKEEKKNATSGGKKKSKKISKKIKSLA
jgi:hypothetical protein